MYDFEKITIGFELEMADIKKENFTLPLGYGWSADETIVNSNGYLVKASHRFGGELNTRPFLVNSKSEWKEFGEIFDQLKKVGFTNLWCHGFAIHLGLPDMDLEGLKKIFSLTYYTGAYVYKLCDIGGWSNYHNQAPIPDKGYYNKVMKCQTLDELKDVLANSSVKGFIRHCVNVTAFYKHGTTEFRLFNTTNNLEHIKNAGEFCSKYLQFALKNDDSVFREIKTYEDFIEKLDFHQELAPLIDPLMFSGDQDYEKDRYVAKRLAGSIKTYNSIKENISTKNVSIVNSHLFDDVIAYRQLLTDKKIKFCNSDSFIDILYRVATKEIEQIKFEKSYSFLNDVDMGIESSLQYLCKILFVNATSRYQRNTEYNRKVFKSIVAIVDKNLAKFQSYGEKIIEAVGEIEYSYTDLNHAIEDAGSDTSLIYSYALLPLVKNSIFKFTDIEYYECNNSNYYTAQKALLLDGSVPFYFHSKNKYLPFNKIGKVNDVIIYSNKTAEEKRYVNAIKKENQFSVTPPPDDYVPNFKTIKVVPIAPSEFRELQKTYVKKIDKAAISAFAFIVMDGDWCLGGFAYSFTKDVDYSLWLLSDFCTNNNVYRLSKLMVLYTKLNLVELHISKKLGRRVSDYYTKVYTSKPSSMKYRGVGKKVKEKCTQFFLVYTNKLGEINQNEIKNKYEQWLRKK